MIILEGPTGAGKSTLAKKLKDDLCCQIYKFGSRANTKVDFISQVKASKRISNNSFAIQDRCPLISDWVYPPFNLDREPYLSFEETIAKLEEFFVVIVWVDTSPLKPRDISLTDHFLKGTSKRYVKMFEALNNINFPFLIYDYKATDYELLVSRIRFLREGIEDL